MKDTRQEKVSIPASSTRGVGRASAQQPPGGHYLVQIRLDVAQHLLNTAREPGRNLWRGNLALTHALQLGDTLQAEGRGGGGGRRKMRM